MLKRNKAWHLSMASHSICMNKLYFTRAWQKTRDILCVYIYSMMWYVGVNEMERQAKKNSNIATASELATIFIYILANKII